MRLHRTCVLLVAFLVAAPLPISHAQPASPPPRPFGLPSLITLEDLTTDSRPERVYTTEGFVFSLDRTVDGAVGIIENHGNQPLTVQPDLRATCPGGYYGPGVQQVPVGGVLRLPVRCEGGAAPGETTFWLWDLRSTASDIGYRPAAPAALGQGTVTLGGYPIEVYGGDGTKVTMVRVGPNTVETAVTNGTARPLAARLRLVGRCPYTDFSDQPLASRSLVVEPGATDSLSVTCSNGAPDLVLYIDWRPQP